MALPILIRRFGDGTSVEKTGAGWGQPAGSRDQQALDAVDDRRRGKRCGDAASCPDRDRPTMGHHTGKCGWANVGYSSELGGGEAAFVHLDEKLLAVDCDMAFVSRHCASIIPLWVGFMILTPSP